jgi:hypothetical protein
MEHGARNCTRVQVEGLAGAESLAPTVFAESHVLELLIEQHAQVVARRAGVDAAAVDAEEEDMRVSGETGEPQFGSYLWALAPESARASSGDMVARLAELHLAPGGATDAATDRAPLAVRLMPIPEAFGTLDARKPFPGDDSGCTSTGGPGSTEHRGGGEGESWGSPEAAQTRCWLSPSAARCLGVSMRGGWIELYAQAAARPAVWPAAVVHLEVSCTARRGVACCPRHRCSDPDSGAPRHPRRRRRTARPRKRRRRRRPRRRGWSDRARRCGG